MRYWPALIYVLDRGMSMSALLGRDYYVHNKADTEHHNMTLVLSTVFSQLRTYVE